MTSAAHFDVNILPEVDMLRGRKSGIDGIDSDFLVRYTVTFSRCDHGYYRNDFGEKT